MVAHVGFCYSTTKVPGALIKVLNLGLVCPYARLTAESRETVSNVHTQARLNQSVAARFLADFHCCYN